MDPKLARSAVDAKASVDRLTALASQAAAERNQLLSAIAAHRDAVAAQADTNGDVRAADSALWAVLDGPAPHAAKALAAAPLWGNPQRGN